jgi:hypothetical protein
MFGFSFGSRQPPEADLGQNSPQGNNIQGSQGPINQLDPGTQEIVAFVEKEFKRREEERRPLELQWRLNAAFLEGNQYVDINTAAGTIDEIPPLYPWQEREVFNHIAPIVETRIAKLSRMRPILKVRPGSGEQQDIRASKICSQLISNVYNDNGIRDLQNEAYLWSEACGSVLFKNVWNPNKGAVIAVAINAETGEREEIREGDIDTVLVPGQEIYPDSIYHQDIKQCKSIIHARAYHVDDTEEIWGVRVKPEKTVVMELQRTMTSIGGLGYGTGQYHFGTTELENHALVKEYHERPTKQHPQGRLIIVAGKQMLYSGPLPFPVDEDDKLGLPFTKVDCITRAGCFFGKTVVERCIPVQRRYNALRNRKAEHLNRVAIGQWTVEDGAVDLDIFEENAGFPGAIHTYQKGFSAPQPVQQPSLPNDFNTELQDLLTEFSMLSGVSEMSRMSQAPPGVKSGVALSIALEQDDTRLSSTAQNVEMFLIENGKQWLRLYKAFSQGMRTIRRIGKDNVVELLDWQASDLRSDDVILDTFSALAESPAQRRQMIFDLLNTPLFIDPETGKISKEMRAKIFEMIEFGNWESADDMDELHISKAERENRIMQTGGQIPSAANYDDHLIHISRHNQFRLTVEYEEMMSQNPLIDLIYQSHVDQHLMALMPAMPSPQTMAPGQGEPRRGEGAA